VINTKVSGRNARNMVKVKIYSLTGTDILDHIQTDNQMAKEITIGWMVVFTKESSKWESRMVKEYSFKR
jgi:hypothetical protein